MRTSDYLTHPVFSTHHSETAMLRYLRRLADRDFALDRGMIPLGSCTMKLNATTEMVAVTWPEFANLHPFAPHEQTEGIRGLVDDLSGWLCEITGYDAVSLQPNAGSQGELAGLLAIHAYHQLARRGGAAGLPHPGERARHERRHRGDGRPQGRRRQDRPGHRQRRHGRPEGQGRAAPRRPRGDHGDLPLDARRLRGHHHRAVRAGPRRRRPGLRRRRQPQRARRAGPARASSAPTSPTSTCTRPSASRTAAAAPASARSACARTWRPSCPTTRSTRRPGRRPASAPISGAPYGSAGILPISWAYVRLMGGVGLTPRHRGGRAQRQLHRGPAARPLPGALLRPRRARRPRVHPRPARHHRRRPASPSTTSPSGSSTTASTHRRCPSRWPARSWSSRPRARTRTRSTGSATR